ncbi:hypothetical protein [[Mycobacterium] wendilense]|uniref:Uncharacterized protein n=1 Tax=[Mycobacterium] wendilense TaxID=3064284 RepID=A0ABN9P381_9MYCO|nr:hypothetical protein [Mycolicibacterium sp. MU0050]CAJ1586038.1 hypothetical protein MU0050_004053 [Mycolicibacterium sp. MU0050]
MILTNGQGLASTVDATAVLVIRAPQREVTLTCGGAEMVAGKVGTGDGSSVSESHCGVTELGKRYVDDETGLELLCTKPGIGALAVDGRALTIKAAKPLPASD